MLKQISFLAAMFAICAFAQDNVEAEPAAPAEALETVEAEPVAPAEATEAIEAEPVAPAEATEAVEAEPASVAEPVPAQPAVVATESAKEAIIENPIEFAIVSAVFLATVLLIALTGN